MLTILMGFPIGIIVSFYKTRIFASPTMDSSPSAAGSPGSIRAETGEKEKEAGKLDEDITAITDNTLEELPAG